MTQEKDSTMTLGETSPDKAADKQKKPRAATRKPPAGKPAAAKAAANDTPEKTAAKPKAAPKKPRATPKKTAAADTPATVTETADAVPAAVAEKAKPAPKTRTAKPKTATKKPAAAQKAAPRKAAASKPVDADEPAQKTAKPVATRQTAAKKPAAPQKAAAKEAAAPKPADADESGHKGAKPEAARQTEAPQPATAQKTSAPLAENAPAVPAKSTPVAEEKPAAAVKPAPPAAEMAAIPEKSVPTATSAPAPATADAPHGEVAARESTDITQDGAHDAARDVAQEDAPAANGEEARPSSSRRSRRGGRRRNKSKSASAVQGEDGATSDTHADTHAETENGAAQAESAPVKDAAKTETVAEKPTSPKQAPAHAKSARPSPAKPVAAKAESGKKESGKEESPKTAVEKTASDKRSMFISVLSGELVEVVLAEGGQVAEYYVEMQHQAKVKGNIYKGVVSNIDANLQAAFISYAPGVKNGFLQIDEVHPEYFVAHHEPAKGRKYPPIQKVLKPGQEILVQVVKEPAGTKGAFLTSYLSLPGRFLVLTPGREQIGVSRKVDNDEERARLRTLLEGLTPGPGLGVIVRTVSSGASKTSLQRDLQFLKRLWREVRGKGQTAPSPSMIYEELDLSTRAVRDYLTDTVHEVWVDDPETATRITELASLLFPKKNNLVQIHHDAGHTLFERFSLQKQLDQIHAREVPLPSGGRLAIDNTEALTAIDINSGRSGGKNNFEDMAFRTNMDAARAIPLQLRLRDIGGQVVVDFIEMRNRDHWRDVEKTVRAGMKGDRARYDVGKVSSFGLMEIVRQRLGSSAISISTEPCPCCKGTGIRRNMEWQAMQALRDIGRMLRQAAANNHATVTYHTGPELAFYLLNTKRSILRNLEESVGVALEIRPAGE